MRIDATHHHTVHAGYATEGQGAAPLVVAQRGGHFAAAGLDVEVRLLHGASNVVAGLLSGAVQFGNLAAPPLLRAALGGAPLVFISGGINQQFLVSRPGVRSLADLQGGRIGAAGTGDLSDLLGQFVAARLAEQGIDGVHVVQVAPGRNRLDGLFDDTMDAMAISPPAALEARARGCHFLVDFGEYGLNYTLGGVATTRTLVDEQPDLVRRFMRGYVAGMHRFKTDRAFALDVLQEYGELRDRAIADATYALTEAGFPRAPYPVTSGLQVLLDLLAPSDPRAAAADPRAFIDDRFVRELDDAGHIVGLYGVDAD